MHRLFVIILLSFPSLFCSEKVKSLYNSLDPASIPEHLALYNLYPDNPYGKQALSHAWELLSGGKNDLPSPLPDFKHIINMMQRDAIDKIPDLNPQTLGAISQLASRLENRMLKGYGVKSKEEILNLKPEEIDIASCLMLDDPNKKSYEAMLDLMALQLLAKLPESASAKDKIEAMNTLVFEKMRFRFPPHSTYSKDIDLYTFLPSVLDSRQGVCLGVSILYLALAERIGLPLEMVTPPGHIYVRYNDGKEHINIETTCRGVHIDDEMYLGIETLSLQQRTKREVLGLVHFNQASTFLQQDKYEMALECYEKAYSFMPDDHLLNLLKGFCHFVLDQKEKGKIYIKRAVEIGDPHSVCPDILADDILSDKGDKECLIAIFKSVDEKRESIIEKRNLLEKVLTSHPEFRSGWFALASSWMQLYRHKEAIEVLEHYVNLNPDDATSRYYLAALYTQRLNYPKAWEHLTKSSEITAKANHHPKALKELKRALSEMSPKG